MTVSQQSICLSNIPGVVTVIKLIQPDLACSNYAHAEADHIFTFGKDQFIGAQRHKATTCDFSLWFGPLVFMPPKCGAVLLSGAESQLGNSQQYSWEARDKQMVLRGSYKVGYSA